MHITIELDGNESQTQLKNIADAVLAIGGIKPLEQIRHLSVGAPIKVVDAGAGGSSSHFGTVRTVGGGGGAASEPVAPVSAAPLAPPAPSTAAADLFPTAPVAPPAGEASAPIVPALPVPSVPTPPVPSAPVAQASPAAGVELDKDGLPWDARIHSSSKAKTQDGAWRQRRNLPDGEKERVEQELRGLMMIPPGGMTLPLVPQPPIAAPVVSAMEQAPPAPSGSIAPPAAAQVAPSDVPNVPSPGTIPPPPVTSVAPPVPPAPPAAPSAGNPFGPLMTKISSNVTQGRLTQAQVHQALKEVGLQPTQITMLAARPDLGHAVSKRIDEFLAGGA